MFFLHFCFSYTLYCGSPAVCTFFENFQFFLLGSSLHVFGSFWFSFFHSLANFVNSLQIFSSRLIYCNFQDRQIFYHRQSLHWWCIEINTRHHMITVVLRLNIKLWFLNNLIFWNSELRLAFVFVYNQLLWFHRVIWY